MTEASVCVVMPTIGRPTLRRAIASVVDQLEADDLLIVVGDSREPHQAADVVESFQPANLFYVEAEHPESVYGNAQRDFGMQLADGRTSHLMFLDDDDVYDHGALDKVRGIWEHSQAGHIFRARWGPGHHAHGVELWTDRVVREQNIATPMVVLPNRWYHASWMQHNGRGVVSDFGFLSAALAELPEVVWRDDLIATVRPD